MTAKALLTKVNPLPWIIENTYKAFIGALMAIIAGGIWALVVFFWNVPARLSDNQREHLEFKARLDSLETWQDQTDKSTDERFGKVYKKISDDRIELYKELWEKRK